MTFHFSRTFCAALAACAALGAAAHAAHGQPSQLKAPGGGEIRAVIVGIDRYPHQDNLKGAVNDASDIDAALRSSGVPARNIRTFIDPQATREAVAGALQSVVNEAKSGDLVIVSFAGHGTRLPEIRPSAKPDHMDEVYVLYAFDKTNPGEVVRGPEMKAWMAALDQKGADALFVADTCHSGGLMRSVRGLDRRDARQAEDEKLIRRIPEIMSPPANGDAQRQLPPPQGGGASASGGGDAGDPQPPRRVTFLAAVKPHTLANEVTFTIGDKRVKRGALSYAVARALEGAAEGNSSGGVTRRALFEYVRAIVHDHTEGRQKMRSLPELEDRKDEVVFAFSGGSEPKPAIEPEKITSLVVAVNGDASALKDVRPVVTPFTLAPGGAPADLVWDSSAKVAIVNGDIAARDVEAAEIPNVVDSVAAVRKIRKLSENRSRLFDILPNHAAHKTGEMLELVSSDLNGKYAMSFSITSNGRVNFLFPWSTESQLLNGRDFKFDGIRVTPPYGKDYAVLVVASEPMKSLENSLRGLGSQEPGASQAFDLLTMYVRQHPDVRIGVTEVVTEP